MTVRELFTILDRKIPRSLSCSWDNDGLMCCPDSARQVRRVLIALDATADVVRCAIDGDYDLIVTHHPFIFRGIRTFEDADPVVSKAIELVKAGISVMSFHTRLDALEGGVNDVLADSLELGNVTVFESESQPIGRIGELAAPMSLSDFALKVKNVLGCPFVLVSDAGHDVLRVAVVGGSGKDMINDARAAGADTFVSGRIDYHPMTDEPDRTSKAINLVEAGHFYTEQPVCSVLRDFIREIDEDIECDITNSNRIKAI